MSIRDKVAHAIVKSCPRAGQSFAADNPEDEATRAANLLREGKWGAYIVDGDPHGHGGEGTLATIYMEQHGDDGDCMLPLEYYADGFDVAYRASEILADDGCYIEFVNAAVAVVVPS